MRFNTVFPISLAALIGTTVPAPSLTHAPHQPSVSYAPHARTHGVTSTEDTLWYQTPFPIQVDGTTLDIANAALGGYMYDANGQEADAFGHAAPFLADVDGDGKRDLVVGSFSGRFRFYRNVGTDAKPAFTKTFTWLKAGDTIAQVRIYCCVASGPQLVDIDGDGILDLSSGSYDPGAIYWFKGLGHGQYATRQMLTDWTGIPLFAHPEQLTSERWTSFMSNIAWVDWNNDGRLDLIYGDFNGEIFVRLNSGTSNDGYTPIASQPVFTDTSIEIRINGEKAVPEYHAAPAIADWDGDGLWDLLVGTDAGTVYWFRNTGTLGKPEFKTRVQLIGPGDGVEQWVEPGQAPRRGIRAQIQVVDYNKDGKPDLLVGDWSYTLTPRSNLTTGERQAMNSVRQKLAALDASVGFDYRNWRHKWAPYEKQKALLDSAEALRKQLNPYLEAYEKSAMYPADSPWRRLKAHGQVWVFLNKGTRTFTTGPSSNSPNVATPSSSREVPRREQSAVTPNSAEADTPVQISLVAPGRALLGDTVTATLTFKIADGWHVYRTPGGSGQRPLAIKMNLPASVAAIADWVWPASETVSEGGDVEVYRGEPSFQRKVRVTSATGNRITLTTTVAYQACNEIMCGPPTTVDVSTTIGGS